MHGRTARQISHGPTHVTAADAKDGLNVIRHQISQSGFCLLAAPAPRTAPVSHPRRKVSDIAGSAASRHARIPPGAKSTVRTPVSEPVSAGGSVSSSVLHPAAPPVLSAMPAPAPCPFHSLWARSSSAPDTYPASSQSPPLPSPSSKATTPASDALSPLMLPSSCTCPASPVAGSHQASNLTEGLLADACRRASPVPAARSLAIEVLRSEARALLAAAERLGDQMEQPSRALPGESFDRALAIALEVLRPRQSSDGKRLRRPKGKLVWCGVGKSGLIGRKLHATCLSLGLKSAFLHPIEALHGDLGIVDRRDAVLVLSNSGATGEVLALTPHLRARGARMIALCGKPDSELAKQSDAWIDCRLPLLHHPTPLAPPAYTAPSASTSTSIGTSSPPVRAPAGDDYEYDSASSVSSECSSFSLRSLDEPADDPTAQEPEAWAAAPAPSSSTTLALAMGDALVFALAEELGHGKTNFALNHPNGELGRQLRLEREARGAQGLATRSVAGDAVAAAPAKPPPVPLVIAQDAPSGPAAALG